MKRVTVKWARNTAAAVGSDGDRWDVDEIVYDGDKVELYLDDQLVASFGRHDADVFLVRDA